MSGRPSQPPAVRYLGVLAALVALVGYVVFDWRFGGSSGPVPVALGLAGAILAVGWTLYRRR